jgi:hypothetical protein
MPFRRQVKSTSDPPLSKQSKTVRFMINPIRTLLLLGAANTFFRLGVLRRVSKLRKRQKKADKATISENLMNAEENDNTVCLICWEEIINDDSQEDVSRPTQAVPHPPSTPPHSPLSSQPMSPMSETTAVDPTEQNDIITELMDHPDFKQYPGWAKDTVRKLSEKGMGILKVNKSGSNQLVEKDGVVQCTRGHRYHYSCLEEWVKERQDKAPRSCEICSTPYIGDQGRALIRLSVQQSLEHHLILPMSTYRTRAERVCATALKMIVQFRRARQQFFDTKYLVQRQLGVKDVEKEFLDFFDLPSVAEVEEKKKAEIKVPPQRESLVALYRKAVEILELYAPDP